MTERTTTRGSTFPTHGWIGLALILIFWTINWTLPGLRTQWAFFPLWLGYCLTVDALVFLRTGTSLLTRSARRYAALFLFSAPVWWIFEAANLRLQNWVYEGAEYFTSLQFFLLATLSFSVVIPAIFGAAELVASFGWFKNLRRGLRIHGDLKTTLPFFIAGWVMLALMIVWPQIFFPFVWIGVYFIIEPVNVWLGNASLVDWLDRGDWRPVFNLWAGALITGFFWEMWNFFSYPKWVYHIPWGNALHIFEMPLPGYGGYLPFALELLAIYHLFTGAFARRRADGFVRVASPGPQDD